MVKMENVVEKFAEYAPCSMKIRGPKPSHMVRTHPYDHIGEYPPGLRHGQTVPNCYFHPYTLLPICPT